MQRKLDSDILSHTEFWSILAAKERELLVYWASVHVLAKHSVVFHAEEKGSKVYVLVSGKVQLVQDAGEANQIVIHVARPGELIGERLLRGASHYNCQAETLEDSTVVEIPTAFFLQILQSNPQAGWLFFQSTLCRLEKTEQRMLNFRFNRTEHRIRAFLKDWVKEEGSQLVTGEWEIRGRLSHAMIASLSTVSRQYVTTFLNSLKKQGVVRYNRRRMVIQRLDLL